MVNLVWQFFIGPLIGFLVGGFPTSYIICKLIAKVDPREFGSGSVSSRNVIRATNSWFWGMLNGTIDTLKGAATCALVEFTFGYNHPNLDYIVVLTALASVAGHCWMPYLGFKGGKGLATLLGTLLFFYWPFGPFIFPILITLLSLLTGFSGVGSVWGVTFISPLFFILDLIGPGVQIIQPIPHPFVRDGTGYGIPFTIVYGFGIILIIVLRYLPEFKKIKSGEVQVWKKLASKDVLK